VTYQDRTPETQRSHRTRFKRRAPRLRDWTRRATGGVRRLIRQLRRHRHRWVRLGAGVALILGGVFAFLPVLGIWMLPLGFIILSDETGYLRRPRRRLQVWLGRRYPRLRRWLEDEGAAKTRDRTEDY
jgi:hypothetical protein